MATLILTAVGTAVAGPIGGMIGSVVGQYVDQTMLFAPKPRHGPRLGELAVQTSTYGSAISKVFGRMRVAGCVIWSTDLIETASAGGGGKGQPKLVSYTYSASFAVLLSARPIRSVGRIWADGKLLRGAAGDFKAPTGYRLYLGDEDQEPDPLIVSAEGVGQAPAYRGAAYAVFEDLQLADYGNRIPSLTFEIEADVGDVAIGAIGEELSAGALVADPTPEVAGYAASGDSVRSALEGLCEIAGLALSSRNGSLRLSLPQGQGLLVPRASECRRRELVRRSAAATPEEAAIVHYDPARDFQTGIQRATLGRGGSARASERRSLPAALEAGAAKALAERRLATVRAARTHGRVSLGWESAGLRPADTLRLEGEAGSWKVARLTLGAGGVEVDLVRLPEALAGAFPPAGSGRPVQEVDLPHGPTLLRLLELPLGDPRGDRPLLFAAAAGEQAGWRRAGLLASFDGGASWEEAGATAAPAMMGAALTALPPAGAALADLTSTVDVELAHAGMWLENASDQAMAGGTNLALVGDELVQFSRAEHLGGRTFRLSGLWRGRRGTDWAAAAHVVGEPFVLLDRATLRAIEAPAGSVGTQVRLSATGVGDGSASAVAQRLVTGESLRPPSPAHLAAEGRTTGDIFISWVRRSRQGWAWPSGGDTPLAEERETYRVTIAGAGFERSQATEAPSFIYAAQDQAADGASFPIAISVVQIGTFASSRPASITFTQ
jgi:hypothetical protein